MVRLGLVAAHYNKDGAVTHRMEEVARETAADHGAELADTIDVPGAYDTPLAADRLARREDIDAVVVIGAIVTGDTDHDQVIGQATARSLQDVSRERDTPVLLGITGPGMSGDEAEARVPKGGEVVESAIDLVDALEDSPQNHHH